MPMTALAGLASGAIGAGLSMAGQHQQYEQQKHLMNKSFDQAQEAQKNSVLNMKEAYQKAGLSVAAMNQSSFQPATGQAPQAPSMDLAGGASKGASAAFQGMEAFKTLALMNAQRDLMNAQTNNQNASADYTAGAKTENTQEDTNRLRVNNEYQQIIVNRENDKDANSAKAMLKLIPDECKKLMDEKGWTEDDFVNNATVGILDGLTSAANANRDIMQARFEFAEAQAKNSPIYLNAVKQLPQNQIDSVNAVISKLAHDEKFLDSMAELNRSNTSLNDNERKALMQSQNKMVQQAVKESVARLNLMNAQKVKTYVNTATDVVNTAMNVASKGLSGSPRTESSSDQSSPYLPGSPTFRNFGFPAQEE